MTDLTQLSPQRSNLFVLSFSVPDCCRKSQTERHQNEQPILQKLKYNQNMPTIVRILLTGASGYLGQHFLHHFVQSPPVVGGDNPDNDDVTFQITALYNKAEHFAKAAEAASCQKVKIIPKQCNLVGLKNDDGNEDDNKYDICIHTAAIANIRVCQNDPELARAVNIPLMFLEATKSIPMIALSTDQVYDGKQAVDPEDSSSFYQEATAKPNPLNVYAETKLAMEAKLKELRSSSTSTYVLRSSIILGPKAPLAPQDAHDTFLHFCATRKDQETDLWTNEYRTVVSVQHVCQVLSWMVQRHIPSGTSRNTDGDFHIFNLGGNLRLNRYQMATAVFDHFGWKTDGILQTADQTSPTVPLDISMDISSLARFTGIDYEPATLEGLIAFTFPKET